jgi:hypothetical protein
MAVIIRPRREGRNQRGVYTDSAEFGSTARRSERMISTRQNFTEERGVVGEVLLLVVGQIGFVVDRPNLANQLAGTAIHALIGVDIHGPGALVDAIHWALLDTRLVDYVHTRSADHIGHGRKVSDRMQWIRRPKVPS